MLLSTGERIACALVAMAIHDLGEEAVSFTGSQAGILTDSVAHAGEDPRDPGRPDPGGARAGEDRARRRLPGLLARHDGRDDARPRRHGRDGGRARGRAGRRVRDLLGRAGGIHRRPADRPGRTEARRRLVRRDARDGGIRREGADAPLGRARTKPRGAHPCALHVLGGGGNLGARGRGNGAADRLRRHPLGDRRRVHADGDPRPARRRGDDLRRGRGAPGQRRHDHPERRPRPRGDVVLGPGRGRRTRRAPRSRPPRRSSARSTSARTTSSARCR